MKIYNTKPEGNDRADLEAARYILFAIEQIQKAEEWLKTTNDICQHLLFHVEVFLLLADQYPDSASDLVDDLDRPQIRQTFNEWFERVYNKLPADLRDGIKSSADGLFDRLEQIEEF